MTHLTTELNALAEREVPAVNERFDISPHAAARLWSEGVPLPATSDHYPPDYYPSPGRILRSADGRWIIRRQAPNLPTDDLSIHDAVDTTMAEFERLQRMGLDVISRGMTTSPMAETIFTVSPWIPDMVPCDQAAFKDSIAPVVTDYFKRVMGSVGLRDISRRFQYSSCGETEGRHFMHDPDPELTLV